MTTTLETTATVVPLAPRARWIDDWRPEDPAFWAATGQRTARRNLLFSILAAHIGFSVGTMWSVLVLFLGPKYGFKPQDKFLLTAVPALVGSVLRLPYTFAVATFGGRNWTVASALLLLAPLGLMLVVLEPGVHLSTLLVVAAVAAVGRRQPRRRRRPAGRTARARDRRQGPPASARRGVRPPRAPRHLARLGADGQPQHRAKRQAGRA